LVLVKGRWCSLAGKVTAGLAESNGSLPPGQWLKSPAGWLPVHWDQLRAQRSVTSMGNFTLPLHQGSNRKQSSKVIKRRLESADASAQSPSPIPVVNLLISVLNFA